MKPKATLKQISKDLGISVSTVSKALSDSHEISEPTKLRVQEYAKLQNYRPNSMAKNLKNQRTNTIGVIIPNILNPFFAKVFSGIEKKANEKGYNVITYISNESFNKEKQAMDLLSNGTVDGFILSVAEESQTKNVSSHFKEILREGLPIVMFDRTMDDVNCDKVIVDDFESSVEAVNHLVKLRCKKIALLSCIDNLSVGKLRALGYERALKDNKIEINNQYIIKTDNHNDFDLRLEKLIATKEIDGIFALDEHASTMAMKMAIQKGIQIPKELCVIGFADGIWSRRLTPSLSTISQHGPEIGEEAAKLLIEKLENKQETPTFKTTVVKTELRQRDSTRRV
ncbi:LacI family DNA-binding transcriptional regulator [Flavobacterium sp.]|uniref:LacI family DNA-binding transcriptional regulator n=1 Tax=Flavobacterium sp. TaxID=239 RepID=UPI00352946E5